MTSLVNNAFYFFGCYLDYSWCFTDCAGLSYRIIVRKFLFSSSLMKLFHNIMIILIDTFHGLLLQYSTLILDSLTGVAIFCPVLPENWISSIIILDTWIIIGHLRRYEEVVSLASAMLPTVRAFSSSFPGCESRRLSQKRHRSLRRNAVRRFGGPTRGSALQTSGQWLRKHPLASPGGEYSVVAEVPSVTLPTFRPWSTRPCMILRRGAPG